jgi:protein involved in polysaccharide export with SLBB domain
MVGSLFLTIALAWLANGDGPQCPHAALQATYLVGDEVKEAAKQECAAGCTRLEPMVESSLTDDEMCGDGLTPAVPNRHVVIELHILNAPPYLAGKLSSDIFISTDQLKELTKGGEPLVLQCPSCCEPSTVATVEDNLEKLQTAQELYNLALLYERLNLAEVASKILSNVKEVCPDSRIASEATLHCDSMAIRPISTVRYDPEFGEEIGLVYPLTVGRTTFPAPYGPREGAKVAQVAYIIEPPDLLTVELFKAAPDRPLMGERLVRTDGTIDLGFYGSVQVAGMTIDEARARVEKYLSTTIRDPKVHLDVYAYNSKGYYVIAEGAGKGDQTVRLPFTGNETVLDAIAQIGGLPPTSDNMRIWLARPGTGVMPINWNAIVKAGDPSTNYQMQPMDRIYIATAPTLRSESTVGGTLKLTGGEEAESLTPVKDSKLGRILTSYRHACSDGNVDLARQLAIEALAIDPTCFGK